MYHFAHLSLFLSFADILKFSAQTMNGLRWFWFSNFNRSRYASSIILRKPSFKSASNFLLKEQHISTIACGLKFDVFRRLWRWFVSEVLFFQMPITPLILNQKFWKYHRSNRRQISFKMSYKSPRVLVVWNSLIFRNKKIKNIKNI